jgi:LL-diaminopimelate aminotransferase
MSSNTASPVWSPVIQPAGRLSQVNEYYFSQKLREIAQMKAQGARTLNLGIGSPDLPPDESTLQVLVEHCRDTSSHAYQSYNGIPELRQAFARWYQRWFGVSLNPDREVLPLIGSKEGIMHIAMTYLEPGDEALAPNPGYPTYRSAMLLTGATVRSYNLEARNGWLPDLDALARQDLSRVKLMWLNYPHMPTGAVASRSFFEELVAFARQHGILLCNDNPYGFIMNDRLLSLLSIDGAMDVALELNSLSKSHNMAGWRVGMLAGSAHYLSDVLRFKSNMDSGMFKPLQLAAAHALDAPDEWYTSLNKVYAQRRAAATTLLQLLGCECAPGQVGMFLWAAVPPAFSDGYALSDELLHRNHVFITPGGVFGSQGDPYVRLSLCSSVELFEEAVRRIKENRKS